MGVPSHFFYNEKLKTKTEKKEEEEEEEGREINDEPFSPTRIIVRKQHSVLVKMEQLAALMTEVPSLSKEQRRLKSWEILPDGHAVSAALASGKRGVTGRRSASERRAEARNYRLKLGGHRACVGAAGGRARSRHKPLRPRGAPPRGSWNSQAPPEPLRSDLIDSNSVYTPHALGEPHTSAGVPDASSAQSRPGTAAGRALWLKSSLPPAPAARGGAGRAAGQPGKAPSGWRPPAACACAALHCARDLSGAPHRHTDTHVPTDTHTQHCVGRNSSEVPLLSMLRS
ncbi:uncharacterized protein LOC141584182 [Saimiri boliviensis]|uniref:uncharacterized protein LOC141584182 n=1 Tax=Saimiri boliviensis TaxID=27679 RepID=UPI003D778D11